MKKLFLFLIGFIVSIALNATVHTVSNNPQVPADYSDLQKALDNAQKGDTVYVYGSETDYGTVNVRKLVHIIGAGYRPANANDLKTTIYTVNFLKDNAFDDASESSISGVEVTYLYGLGATGVTVSRCYVSYILKVDADNWMVYNNLINYLQYLKDGCLVYNNIITNYISNSYSTKVIVSNNLFIGSGNATSDVDGLIFTNNIYYGKDPINENNSDYNTFTNNLSIGNDNPEFLVGTQTGGDNYVKVNPLFVKAAGLSFEWEDNYTLQKTSPIYDKEIGIHVGQYQWPMKPDGSMDFTGMPRIPQIVEMNVLNASVPVGGTLEVQVKARTQN